jgi:hypothetical protein
MKPRQEQRDRLYFDRYQYRLTWNLPNASLLRCRDLEDMAFTVDRRRRFMRMEAVGVESVKKVFETLPQITVPYKKVINYSELTIYTNQPQEVVDQLTPHMPFRVYTLAQAQVTLPRDVVLLTNPQHSLRTYLRDRRLDTVSGEQLRRFFLARIADWGYSDNFTWRLQHNSTFQHMHDYFFFDHDDARDCIMLEMVSPGIVRKTMPIQAK